VASMLHIAGIIEIRTMGRGKRDIIVKDKERLERVLREKRIIW